MSERIIILPSVQGGDALRIERRDGAVSTQRGPLKALHGGGPVRLVVLPGQLVRGLVTDLPERLKPAERLSVARFAHEDRLATDPAGLHIVVGVGAAAPTRAVDPSVMADVIEALDPDRIIADFDALPDGTEAVRLLDRVVRPGADGHAVDADWAEPGAVVLSDDALAERVLERLDAGGLLNLRTGPYRRRRHMALGPWLRVAAAALLCAVLGLGWLGVEARATQAQAAALDAQSRALFEARTGRSAPARLSALAREAGADPAASTRFLELSHILFRAVDATPGTQVESLSFEPAENRLRLALIFPDFDAAAALEASVAREGGRLTTGGVRERGGRFTGDAALDGGTP